MRGTRQENLLVCCPLLQMRRKRAKNVLREIEVAGGARNCREYAGKKEKIVMVTTIFRQMEVDATKFVKINVTDAIQFVTSAR